MAASLTTLIVKEEKEQVGNVWVTVRTGAEQESWNMKTKRMKAPRVLFHFGTFVPFAVIREVKNR